MLGCLFIVPNVPSVFLGMPGQVWAPAHVTPMLSCRAGSLWVTFAFEDFNRCTFQAGCFDLKRKGKGVAKKYSSLDFTLVSIVESAFFFKKHFSRFPIRKTFGAWEDGASLGTALRSVATSTVPAKRRGTWRRRWGVWKVRWLPRCSFVSFFWEVSSKSICIMICNIWYPLCLRFD